MRANQLNWKNNPTFREILLSEIQTTPTNLTAAFARTAEQINASTAAVSQYWYKKMRRNIKGFTVSSKGARVANTKNSVRRKTSTIANDLSNPIHETVVSTKKLDGMRVVTIKKYFID